MFGGTTTVAPARVLALVSFALILAAIALLSDRAAAASGWQIVLDRPTPNFGGVDFVSDDEGWMPAGAGLLHTTDGGATWTENAKLVVNDVDFFDQRHGWAGGYNGIIYGTSDGGRTWAAQDTGLAGVYFPDVEAVSASEAWATGLEAQGDVPRFPVDSPVLHTTDGGATWQHIELPENSSFEEIEFMGTNGWLLGTICEPDCTRSENIHRALLRTTDGGTTWSTISDGIPQNAEQMTFADDQHGWMIGRVGVPAGLGPYVFHTEDGGVTWQQQLGTGNELESFAGLTFKDASTGWAVISRGMLPNNVLEIDRTTDGGTTWTELAEIQLQTTQYDARLSHQAGRLFLTANQLAMRSTDEGTTWQSVSQPAMLLSGLDFVDRSTGFAISSGSVLRTDDAGASWTRVADAPSDASRLLFTDADHGIAAGANCCGNFTTYLTDDGGHTWRQTYWTLAFDGSTYIRDMEFADDVHGWIALDGGFLFTSDGGNSWRERSVSDLGPYVVAADLADAHHAWATISSASYPEPNPLYTTEDEGATWQQVSGDVPPAEILEFVDALHGWAVGSDCTTGGCQSVLSRTTDGGDTWQQALLSAQGLYPSDFVFTDELNGWVEAQVCDEIGCRAEVQHTADGGITWFKQLEHPYIIGALEFADARNGWLALDPNIGYGVGGGSPQRTVLYHTTDGGGGPIGEVPPDFPDVGDGFEPSHGNSLLPLLLGAAGVMALAGSFALRRRVYPSTKSPS